MNGNHLDLLMLISYNEDEVKYFTDLLGNDSLPVNGHLGNGEPAVKPTKSVGFFIYAG